MADEKLRLLRGNISGEDDFSSPQGGGRKAAYPNLDPIAHHKRLKDMLEDIVIEANARVERDEIAEREIVAIHPTESHKLEKEQLDSVREDARLVGEHGDTGTVLLDVKDLYLNYLRKKIDNFANDTLASAKSNKDGTSTIRRSNQDAIGPIDRIELASWESICGTTLKGMEFLVNRKYWFEVACRGGYRRPDYITHSSRVQIVRQLLRMEADQKLNEFSGPEMVYFFIQLTIDRIKELQSTTDCILEIELPPSQVRDMLLQENTPTSELMEVVLSPPPFDAPSVVVLDTGIATKHPLLEPAIITATVAGDAIPSPEDVHGHGTKMAGAAVYKDLGSTLEKGEESLPHWLQSVRLMSMPGKGISSDEHCDMWPISTEGAIISAESSDEIERNRVYVMAVTRSMQTPPYTEPTYTLWSSAVDKLAYNGGMGRFIVVSAGNAAYENWLGLAEQFPEQQLTEKVHQPGQAMNALTVGALTTRVDLPPLQEYEEYRVVAEQAGGISPYTSTGMIGSDWAIKPEVLMEGGNLAVGGDLPDSTVPTLSSITTSVGPATGYSLGWISMTSEAAARVAYLAAEIWKAEPTLRPESVRALIVNSAMWTSTMNAQFKVKKEKIRACGYGGVESDVAYECTQNRATVVVEGELPNAVKVEVPKKMQPKKSTTKKTDTKYKRRVKYFRLPIPHYTEGQQDEEVELRVTLSYFAEQSKFGGRKYNGLSLKWNMQGPLESEEEFKKRVNKQLRQSRVSGNEEESDEEMGNKKSFDWEVGIRLRSYGTIQSDRWTGMMSQLAGDKLIAIIPTLGWWDDRKELKENNLRFSLVVTVTGTGIYSTIESNINKMTQVQV